MAPTSEQDRRNSSNRGSSSRAYEATKAPEPPISPQMQHAMRTLVLDRTTAEVVLAWRRAGVRSVLLKGPAITRWLYSEDQRRGYVDIDLLVPDSEVETGQNVLKGLGFERHGLETIEGDWPRYSRTWIRSDIEIDLHQTLAGVGVPPATLWMTLTEGLEQIAVAGVDVDVLAPEARALALALHTAKDGPRIAKARHDLAHAIDRLPPDLWVETERLADRVGAMGSLAAGLRLVVPSGVELADRLGLPAVAPFDIAIRSRGGAPALAFGIDWLISSPGIRGKGRLVLRKIFPPATFVRAWSPLARRGRVGLGAAYVYRPLWVLGHAGPALWALARARKRAGRGRTKLSARIPVTDPGEPRQDAARQEKTRPILPYSSVPSLPGRSLSKDRPDLQAARRARSSEAARRLSRNHPTAKPSFMRFPPRRATPRARLHCGAKAGSPV